VSQENKTFDEAIFKRASEKAVLVEIDKKEYWIPKSQIVDTTFDENSEPGDIGEIEMTGWIAEQKGLD
jgi:hypothetical protein